MERAAGAGGGWDRGAWFGSQVGGTLWMAIAAAVLLPGSAAASTVVAACFLAANAFGWRLWARRSRLRALPAQRALVSVIALASLVALGAAQASGEWQRLEVGGRVPPAAAYAVVIGVGGLMLLVLLRRECAAR